MPKVETKVKKKTQCTFKLKETSINIRSGTNFRNPYENTAPCSLPRQEHSFGELDLASQLLKSPHKNKSMWYITQTKLSKSQSLRSDKSKGYIPWQNYSRWLGVQQRNMHTGFLSLSMEVLGTWATLHQNKQLVLQEQNLYKLHKRLTSKIEERRGHNFY